MRIDIPGFPGYSVDAEGVVWSTRRYANGKALKPGPQSRGYLTVALYDGEGRQRSQLVHRLVLEAFSGPCPEGMQARHLDGDRTNNSARNLAWGTPLENAADKRLHGTEAVGEQNPAALLSRQQVKVIRELPDTVSSRDIALLCGVSVGTAQKARSGRSWRHLPGGKSQPLGRRRRS